MQNCFNCGGQQRSEQKMCDKCFENNKDLWPSGYDNKQSFTIRFGIRQFAIIMNLSFFIIGGLWYLASELPFIGIIPEAIGLPFLFGGIIGILACMICYR